MLRIAVLLCVSAAAPRPIGLGATPEAQGISTSTRREIGRRRPRRRVQEDHEHRHRQNGKLVYEAYFDGDATSCGTPLSGRQDHHQRLVGMAIAERRLSGSTRGSLAPPERARRSPTPIQKARTPSRTCCDERAARVRRLERLLARQRGADVPHRGLDAVLARSADPRLGPRVGERGAPRARPPLQLLHGRRLRARRGAGARHQHGGRSLRAAAAVHPARHHARAVGTPRRGRR